MRTHTSARFSKASLATGVIDGETVSNEYAYRKDATSQLLLKVARLKNQVTFAEGPTTPTPPVKKAKTATAKTTKVGGLYRHESVHQPDSFVLFDDNRALTDDIAEKTRRT